MKGRGTAYRCRWPEYRSMSIGPYRISECPAHGLELGAKVRRTLRTTSLAPPLLCPVVCLRGRVDCRCPLAPRVPSVALSLSTCVRATPEILWGIIRLSIECHSEKGTFALALDHFLPEEAFVFVTTAFLIIAEPAMLPSACDSICNVIYTSSCLLIS